MTEHIAEYIKRINQLYQTHQARELSYRADLKRLVENCLGTGYLVINEPERIACGAPDMAIKKKDIQIAYIETKDIEDGDLDGRKKNKEQFDRYKASLDTIIFTDYLDFRLYEHGEWKQSVRLAEIQGDKIRLSDPERFIALMEHLKTVSPQKITSASKLAQIMAGKARLLRDIIELALIQDGDKPSELHSYMDAFQKVLIHDITPKKFADIYAQTIAYGMFAARLNDTSPENFTRSEASELIPKSNPFLRKVFQQIAGYDLDERIKWIVDDLVAAFAATDMEKIMAGFGKSTEQTDPILHFYEDFLYQYDSSAKKQCGVYYTPQPVVNFIVRAVDDILRSEFNLPMGLADTSKIEVMKEIPQDPKHRKEPKLYHRVQVLDPATGTGTFLAETVRQIKRDLKGQMGAWTQYVPEHLLPRLHGFELMMAPYTIAHLKLDMEIGVPTEERLRVFLTNSLEEYNKEAHTLFGYFLAEEANKASDIKRDAPVMIVMGNPPYSVSSSNKGKEFEWIDGLLNDYKKNLNEKKLNLDDDYIKFIRLAQHYVERNGEGILAYICNNSFIDGITHRRMRNELMRVFDKIYILDLHGNARKNETCPDGSKDENVFDIMQGVSINIFVKKKAASKQPAEVYHYDLFGKREHKYAFLQEHDFANVDWKQLTPQEPYFFYVLKDFSLQDEYDKGFKVDELMKVCNSGIQTDRDPLFIDNDSTQLENRIKTLLSPPLDRSFIDAYNVNDSSSFKLTQKIQSKKFEKIHIRKYEYRPFDFVSIYYDWRIISRPAYDVMRHMLQSNMALLTKRGFPYQDRPQGFVTNGLSDRRAWSSSGMQGAESVFPLYLYPEEGSLDTERRPNLNADIWAKINASIGRDGSPEDIFHYIYGILHSPHYREKYKEFLKVDFPRIPYPKNADEFEHYCQYGERLAELHLMKNVPTLEPEVQFLQDGSMTVEQIKWMTNLDAEEYGSVWINDTQYFSNVPKVAWDMYIGGYQPAQKWLKDRKGRTLSYKDIEHYIRIIAVLSETHRIMQLIDRIG